MKKFISTLVAIATLANTGMVMTNASAEKVTIKGDITRDGVVDYYDIIGYLRNYAVLVSTLPVTNPDGSLVGEIKTKDYLENYKELFKISDEEYTTLDLNSDGNLDPKEAITLMRYFDDVKAGYKGDLDSKSVDSYFYSLPKDQRDKAEKERFDEMHALGLVRTNEEIEEEFQKEYEKELSNRVYTKCDLNNDGIIDAKDVELMKQSKVGDANNDGSVDSKDAVTVLSNYANEIATSSNNKNTASVSDSKLFVEDINGDGVIDSKDAIGILQTYAESLANNR